MRAGLLSLLVLVLVLVACSSDSKPASDPPKKQKEKEKAEKPIPKPKAKVEPDGEVIPPNPHDPEVKRPGKLGEPLDFNAKPPELDPKITGFDTKDPSAHELRRCKNTGWSFLGCWTVYPLQGRIWTKFECEHVIDDYQRNVMCGNYATHLAVGDGGPPDRAAGLAILKVGCDAGKRTDCAHIAQLLMWDDPAAVEPYLAKACTEDPRNSPMGLCEDLTAAKAKLTRFAVTITEVSGLDGISKTSACSLGLIAHGSSCRVRFACGDRVLYGATSGSAPCKATSDGLAGGETMTSADDNDPAIQFDPTSVVVHDAASAVAPAWELRGTLTPAK